MVMRTQQEVDILQGFLLENGLKWGSGIVSRGCSQEFPGLGAGFWSLHAGQKPI
jgi:hypothetical protein